MVEVPEEVTGFGPQEELLPDEVPPDGAIRMVAFGVLEHKPPSLSTGLFQEEVKDVEAAQEIEQLVTKEINARGWKLSVIAFKQGREFILLGKLGGSIALPTRPKIGQGTLQEVCKAAVRWLDDGPQPSPVLGRDEDRYLKR